MMERALWASASGMAAAAVAVDVVGHNLANVNTPGFKEARADFQDLVYTAIQVPVAPADPMEPVPLGHGVTVAAIPRRWHQGPLQETGSQWDLAVEGAGFFRVVEGGQVLYTRSGAFRASPQPDGTLWVVDPAGRPLLLNDGQPLILPPGSQRMEVTPDGQVWAELAGGQRVPVGLLTLGLPATGDALEARGDGLFAWTGAGPVDQVLPGEAGAGRIRQGFLEQSNVSLEDQMTRLLMAQRAYALNAQAVRTADEMMGLINRLRS